MSWAQLGVAGPVGFLSESVCHRRGTKSHRIKNKVSKALQAASMSVISRKAVAKLREALEKCDVI
jgi:hypothetical protein